MNNIISIINIKLMNKVKYSNMSKELLLPVSLGEALDKLTILDIKLHNVTDDRKHFIETEYNLLFNKLEYYVSKYNNLYQILKNINMIIWDLMNDLRDGDGNLNEKEYYVKCKECIDYNDIRFRAKNKINFVSNSLLKEKKGYIISRIYIKVENIKNYIKEIKCLSFIYDEVIIYCNEKFDFNDENIIFVNDINYNNFLLLDKDLIMKLNIKDNIIKIFSS